MILVYQIIVRICLKRMRKHIKNYLEKTIATTKESNSLAVSMLGNMLTIRSGHKETYFNEKYYEKENRLRKLKLQHHLLENGRDDLVWATLSFAEYFLMYGIGGVMVCFGLSELSTILAFAFALGQFVNGVNSLSGAVGNQINASANIETIDKFLDSVKPQDNQGSFEPQDNAVFLKDICFSYGEKEVLHNINLEIASGELVEIVGPSGSGKSTLVSLVTGMQKYQSGSITIGGADISESSFQEISAKCCYISQRSQLFAGTIMENIAMSKEPDVALCKQILDILHMGHCQDLDPFQLSQGEKQRVNIGRAFYKFAKNDIKVLICDEIFANLDVKNSEEIAQSLTEYFKGCTIIFISHQPINIAFDKVVRIEEGNLEVM